MNTFLGFDKNFLKNHPHAWKFDLIQARTKKRRISKKTYKRYLLVLIHDNYRLDLHSWNMMQIRCFISKANLRFRLLYEQKTKHQINRAVKDALKEYQKRRNDQYEF